MEHVASDAVSLNSLSWKTIRVGHNGKNVAANGENQTSELNENDLATAVGGGSMRRHRCESRFFAWRSAGSSLWLAEVDLLSSLKNSAIHLTFGDLSGVGNNTISTRAHVALFESEEAHLSVCILTDQYVVHRLYFQQPDEEPEGFLPSVFSGVYNASNEDMAIHEMFHRHEKSGLSSFFARLQSQSVISAGNSSSDGNDTITENTFRWVTSSTLLVASGDGTISRLSWDPAMVGKINGGLQTLPHVSL